MHGNGNARLLGPSRNLPLQALEEEGLIIAQGDVHDSPSFDVFLLTTLYYGVGNFSREQKVKYICTHIILCCICL